MIYYQYKANYKNKKNLDSEVVLTRSCDDNDFDNHLSETEIIAKQVMKKACDDLIPPFNESVIFLTLAQYNSIVKGPDNLEINPEIIIDNDENI
jgi:hypothetical protein